MVQQQQLQSGDGALAELVDEAAASEDAVHLSVRRDRLWLRLFAAGQARTTLNGARSASLQAKRSLFGSRPKSNNDSAACPIRAQYCAQLRSLMACHGQPFPLRERKPPSQGIFGFVFQVDIVATEGEQFALYVPIVIAGTRACRRTL